MTLYPPAYEVVSGSAISTTEHLGAQGDYLTLCGRTGKIG
jgi:hypothetical protein